MRPFLCHTPPSEGDASVYVYVPRKKKHHFNKKANSPVNAGDRELFTG